MKPAGMKKTSKEKERTEKILNKREEKMQDIRGRSRRTSCRRMKTREKEEQHPRTKEETRDGYEGAGGKKETEGSEIQKASGCEARGQGKGSKRKEGRRSEGKRKG